jgi:hypothetical protein
MEEKYLSIQEEVAAKTKKLKKLWNRYEQVFASHLAPIILLTNGCIGGWTAGRNAAGFGLPVL